MTGSKLFATVTLGVALVGASLALGGCASCSRMTHNIDSDMSGGTQKKVTVYDNDGDVLAQYEGKIDIETSDSGKMAFQLDGKYYVINGGTVVVEEE